MKKQIILGISAALAIAGTAIGAYQMAPERSSEFKLTAGGSAVYGFLSYSSDYDIEEGLYSLDKSGAKMKWKAPDRYYLSSGWLKDGKLCGYGEKTYGSTVQGREYQEIDFETGKQISVQSMSLDDAYFQAATLNPNDNIIYGYGKDSSGNNAFMKASASAPTTLEVVKAVSADDMFISICYNPVDEKIYGITANDDHQLVMVDASGEQTVVMALTGCSDVSPDYVTGLVYSPVEDLFYWDKYEGDEEYSSSLNTIDVNAGTTKQVKKYSNEEQFSVFVTTDKYTVTGQPASCKILSLEFSAGSQSGSMAFSLPSADISDNAITGDLNYEVKLDDQSYKTGSAAAGSNVTVAFTDVAEGLHTFSVTAEKNGLKSERAYETKYIGYDTPEQPTNLLLTEDSLSWDAVTTGVNGGYIDTADVEYEVSVNGESKGSTKATSMAGLLPADADLQWYQAEVVAVCHEKSSTAAASNKCLAGKALELPVSLTPTTDEFALMQRFDVDGDSYSWKCRDGYMEHQWSLSKDGGDDWIILAPINLPDASAIYTLAFDAKRNMSESDRESLEVKIGKVADPEQMEDQIMPTFTPLDSYTNYSQIFEVKEAGRYYIAFHAKSMKYEYGYETGQCVKNISVTRSAIVSKSPGAVTDLTAVAGEKGALEAKVTFKMPTTSYDGSPLEAESVTATVTGEEEKSVSGAPGSEQSVTVATKQGENVIRVVTSLGESEGTPVTVNVYTGVVIPGLVENLNFETSEDMLSVKLTWDAPTSGLTEGYVDPATTVYKIYEGIQSFYDYYWELVGTTNPGVTNYTYSVKAGAQKSHTLVVMAENVAGHGDDMYGGDVLLGTPYSLPMLEDFENGYDYFQYSPWLQYEPDELTTGYWSVWYAENVVSGVDEDEDEHVLIGKSSSAGTKGVIGVPAFTADSDPGEIDFSMQVILNGNTPKTTITGKCYGYEEERVLATLPGGNSDELQDFIFTLPEEFSTAPWIQLFINTEYSASTNLLVMDNIEIKKRPGTGVKSISTDGVICSGKGFISIRGLAGEMMNVYTLSGALVASQKGISEDETVSLQRGVYIVTVGNRRAKVMVR